MSLRVKKWWRIFWIMALAALLFLLLIKTLGPAEETMPAWSGKVIRELEKEQQAVSEVFKPVPLETVLLTVPFTPQAPFAEWDDARFQDGCEEAAVLMAVKWVKGEGLTLDEAKETILAMAQWQLKNYSSATDTNAADTAARLLAGYFSYENFSVVSEVKTAAIIEALRAGKIVLVPTNGRKLKNPYYKYPGPERHMLLIRGYDERRQEFITNDPGTRRGENYRYPYERVITAALDYPSGDHTAITEESKAMIIIAK